MEELVLEDLESGSVLADCAPSELGDVGLLIGLVEPDAVFEDDLLGLITVAAAGGDTLFSAGRRALDVVAGDGLEAGV